jgi:hypothetical protein
VSSALSLGLQQADVPSTERYSRRIGKRTERLKKSARNTSMEKTPEDSAMRRTHQAVAVVGVALSLCGLSFFGVFVGVSVLIGATVAGLNLLVLARTVRAMVEGRSASWAGVALLKFLVLLAVTYGLITHGFVHPLALAVGFGALPFGILVAGTMSPRPDNTLQSPLKSDLP